MLGVVVSRADDASTHVGEHLRDLADWRTVRDEARPDGQGGGRVWRLPDAELREFDALHLDLEAVDRTFEDAGAIAVASRHSGETGALLTAHHTGNFAEAELGGRPQSFARAAPNAQKAVLRALAAEAPPGYDVGVECTHHGPTGVDTPFLFVELGSGEEQWTDPDGARAVASAILALRGVAPDRERTLVGVGGGHYAPRFERVLRETGWAVGHVAADWALEEMVADGGIDPDVLARAVDRSGPGDGPGRVLLDGDGERPAVRRAVEAAGARVVSETWVREVDGVPLALAERIEERVATVDEGLRFGDLADAVATDPAADPGTLAFATVDLPGELVAACNGIDRTRTLATAREHALAVVTDDAGNRLGDRAVFPAEDAAGGATGTESGYDAVVDALVAVLEAKYDRVERTDGAVVAHERAFSPERARALGIEEGPAFGRLSNDQEVERNGETIPPDAVHEERKRRFPIG